MNITTHELFLRVNLLEKIVFTHRRVHANKSRYTISLCFLLVLFIGTK